MTKADVKPNFANLEPMINILRILSMLEKALNRVARRKYHDRSQYPRRSLNLRHCLKQPCRLSFGS